MFGVVYKRVKVGGWQTATTLFFMVLILMKCGYFGYKYHRPEHPLQDV